MEQQPELIGVCLSTLYDEDRYNFVKKLNKFAVDSGYRLLIFNSVSDLYERFNKNNEGASSVFRLIPYKKLSAMIVFPSFIRNEDIVDEIAENCRKNHIPLISIDKELTGGACFSFDYADAFETLCNHVIKFHGAKKLYLITGSEGNNYAEERRAAYRRALEKNGIAYDEDKVGYGDFWEGPTNAIMMRWFDIEKRDIPDAIICANDVMAITVSNFLQKRGYRVPGECIVTGFDGIEQAHIHSPSISTCEPDYAQMAKQIIEAVKNKNVSGRHKVDCSVVYSHSCGCRNEELPNFNRLIHRLVNHIHAADERYVMMCSMQSAMAQMKDISELPPVMTEKFGFHTAVLGLNNDVFDPPDFGKNRRGQNSFSNKIDIIYQRYYWYDRAPCIINAEELIPHINLMIKRNEPIVVCTVNYIERVMGYCVFQPDIDNEEYKKIHAFINALGAALANFHSKIQIHSMNERLIMANKELNLLSQRDYMTGLFNRRGFYDRFNEMTKADNQAEYRIAVISADLDRLKFINDTYGHHEGDDAIRTVSRALVSSSVQGEVCARFGGDEFCVAAIVPPEKAEYYFNDFKERFCDYLYDYNRKSGKQYVVEASIGCCVELIGDGIDIESMIRVADENMYVDKMEHRKSMRNS